MKCPHCQVEIHEYMYQKDVTTDNYENWFTRYQNCPSCKKSIIYLFSKDKIDATKTLQEPYLIYPKTSGRALAPSDVPSNIAEDYNEATLILNYSPKASAALSRKCLQATLREIKSIHPGSLDSEINQAIRLFPSYIGDAMDAIRKMGNFTSYPKKSESVGEIMPVQAGEAEWALEVLELLFDFCYVQPKILKDKKAKLDEKLANIGKPSFENFGEIQTGFDPEVE